MLLAIDLHEYFIDIERITKSSVLTLQTAGINGSEFYTPEADRFSADSDTSLSKEVFNIPVAQVESEVELDSIGDDI